MSTFIIAGIVLIIDQLTKYMIQTNESLHHISVIPGFFHITYAQNTGMAWSLLSGQTMFLSLAAVAAVGGMIWYLKTSDPDRLTKFCLALMIGGALGNLFDRVVYAYVRDFLDFYIFGYDFPIFNVADSALCIGVFLLMISTLKEGDGRGGKQMDS